MVRLIHLFCVVDAWKPTGVAEGMLASQRDTIIRLHAYLRDALPKLKGPLKTRGERLLYQSNLSREEPRIKPLSPNPEEAASRTSR